MKHNRKPRNSLQIGFVLDPVEQLLFWEDTSVAIMEEAEKRGYETYYFEPQNMFARDGKLLANVKKVHATQRHGIQVRNEKTVDLSTFDIIFNRKEPPFDLSYLYLTQMLELISHDVFVVNAPRGVRKANEKLYILEFEKWIPPSLVTNDPVRIKQFQAEKKIDLILKPLDQKGGEGIVLLPFKSKRKNRILTQATCVGTKWILAQKFLKQNLKTGDKRILVLNGKAIGQFQRIPKKGEFRSNISRGGQIKKALLSDRERKLVRSLAPQLKQDGLYFVGLDVVDGFLIEINVTSPAGIPEITELEGAHPEVAVVDFLEDHLRCRPRSKTPC